MMWAQILATAVGVWLMAAPAVLGYERTLAADIDRIIGPTVATFACVAIWQVTRGCRWVNVLLGLGMLPAPLFLAYPAAAVVNSLLSGLALISLSLVRGRERRRIDGGWRMLWPFSPSVR